MSPYLTIARPEIEGGYEVVAALIKPQGMTDGDFAYIALLLKESLCPSAVILERQDLPETITPDHQTDIARSGE